MIILAVGMVILAVLMYCVNLIFSLEAVKSNMSSVGAWLLVCQSIVMILTFGTMSFLVFQGRFGTYDFGRWFLGLMPEDISGQLALCAVGMASSITFGFLDNAGLFFGSN